MQAIVVARKFVHTKGWVLFCNSQIVEGEEFSVQSSERGGSAQGRELGMMEWMGKKPQISRISTDSSQS